MPAPGSRHALVLPTASSVAEDPDTAAARLTPELAAFLDETKYTAVAVVHGLSDSAANGFDLAKVSRPARGGVVWVTDAEFLTHLTGAKAAKLKTLLTPKLARVMSFFSVAGGRITGHLHWAQLGESEVDEKFAAAARNRRD